MSFKISLGYFVWFGYRCQNIIIIFLIRQATENVSLLGFSNLIEMELKESFQIQLLCCNS